MPLTTSHNLHTSSVDKLRHPEGGRQDLQSGGNTRITTVTVMSTWNWRTISRIKVCIGDPCQSRDAHKKVAEKVHRAPITRKLSDAFRRFNVAMVRSVICTKCVHVIGKTMYQVCFTGLAMCTRRGSGFSVGLFRCSMQDVVGNFLGASRGSWQGKPRHWPRLKC